MSSSLPGPALADARLAELLRRVPGLEAAPTAVTPLPGGITNRNYRVEVGGQAVVVRVAGEDSHLLGIDRRHEHAASAIAAALGVGAEVVVFLPAEKVLITRFIEGRAVTPEEARRPETLRRIVESLRAFHGGPAFPGRFSPFEAVRSYRTLALKSGVALPTRSEKALETLGRIEKALGPASAPRPCHNDLLAGNFLDDGRRIRILDWEYAGMGDVFFDLGNFAANQELGPGDCEEFLRVYAGEVRRRELARLHLQRLASDMRESFWGFVQEGISRIEFDYRSYAERHLDRFLERSRGADLPRWLEAAAGA